MKRTLTVSIETCVNDSLALTGADGFNSWGAVSIMPVNVDRMKDNDMMQIVTGRN